MLRRPMDKPVVRYSAGVGEMQDIGALARFAAEALAKRFRDIGFVVDDEDAETHAPLPACASAGGTGWGPRRLCRGRRIVNSVNSPSPLSTAIVPPCAG